MMDSSGVQQVSGKQASTILTLRFKKLGLWPLIFVFDFLNVTFFSDPAEHQQGTGDNFRTE